MPLLSIILPTYNRIDLIEKSINSILNQTFSDFELIIVDDASSDNTCSLIKNIKDNRIRFYQLDKNKGEYWVTNYAVSLSCGKYLTWVHSDDLLPQDSLELRINKLINNPELDFISGAIKRIDENDNVFEVVAPVYWSKDKILEEYLKLPDERKVKYMIHHLTIMMKRDFFEKIGGFDTELNYAGDIDWLIRAIKYGNFKSYPEVFYYYRSHPNTRRNLDPKNGVNKDLIYSNIINKYKKTWTL